MKTLLYVVLLYQSQWCQYLGLSESTEPYINEFFFKLSREDVLHSVQEKASKIDFVYLRKVITRLHLFRKNDLPINNEEPESNQEIAEWMEIFGESVEYIEQDQYIQIYKRQDRVRFGNGIPKSDVPTTTQEPVTSCPAISDNCPTTTGRCKPIKIAVLDAVFDLYHKNLKCNILKELAHDFIDDSHLEDSLLEYVDIPYYNHGTMCMGRIASSAEYGCSEGGDVSALIIPLKFIDGDSRGVNEIMALRYKDNETDIYSCSYGTKENVGFSSKRDYIEEALTEGVSKGRDCKGSIYLFPSGNGNGHGKLDNCNTDIYANSVNTITIASISMAKDITEESETCPCTLVATYGSSDPQTKRFMNTTKPLHQCDSDFRGTSAATAYAAGMISHALKENPSFTKRDIEYLLISTADTNLGKGIKWQTNGAGYKFNDRIGFGAINLEALKEKAKAWKHVPEKRTCTTEMGHGPGRIIRGKLYSVKSNACQDTSKAVKKLEHVQLKVELSCNDISDVAINLISPSGTKVGLLTKISVDDGMRAYENLTWTFMTVQFWGEDPNGTWTVEFHALGNNTARTKFYVRQLILHGIVEHSSAEGQSTKCENISPQSTTLGTSPQPNDQESPSAGVYVLIVISIITVIAIICGIWHKRRIKDFCCKSHQTNSNGTVELELQERLTNGTQAR